MSLKFINAGGFGNVADAVEALNYAIDRKSAGVNLRVINASWGLTEPSRALEDMIRKRIETGILFVAASGNTSRDNDATPRYPASYNIGNIISVAATDKSGALAQFSNYGAKSVTVAAPGKNILTTALGNDYKECSGTSMAAADAYRSCRPVSVRSSQLFSRSTTITRSDRWTSCRICMAKSQRAVESMRRRLWDNPIRRAGVKWPGASCRPDLRAQLRPVAKSSSFSLCFWWQSTA